MFLFSLLKLKTLSIETKKKNQNSFFKVLNIKIKKQIIKKKKTKKIKNLKYKY